MSQRERPHVSRALGLPRVQGGQSAEQSTGGGVRGRGEVRGRHRCGCCAEWGPSWAAVRPGLGGGDGEQAPASGPTFEAGSVEFPGGRDKRWAVEGSVLTGGLSTIAVRWRAPGWTAPAAGGGPWGEGRVLSFAHVPLSRVAAAVGLVSRGHRRG